MGTNRYRQRGVSLVEALVAFGVMAFGMIAVVGMQSTLRTNGDLARQRAEAVRIGQDAVEAWRGFTTLDLTTSRTAYANVATGNTTVGGTNATFTVVRQANDPSSVNGTVTPRLRSLVVDVSWLDRSGQTQMIRLGSTLAGIAPEVTGSLVLAANADPVVSPRFRHRSIPPGAVALPGVGRSGYVPPGQPTGGSRVAWVFNNADGVITLCSTSGLVSSDLLFATSAPNCGTQAQRALLISGVVRFGTGFDPSASPLALANPAGSPVGFGVQVFKFVNATSEAAAELVSCYQDAVADNQQPYYCAVPISPESPRWSGRIDFVAPLALATTGSTSISQFRVCRYQEVDRYNNIDSIRLNQNFVIIQAGNGSSAYSCPSTSTPRVWAHQPRTTS